MEKNKTMKIRIGYWDKSCRETLSVPTGEAHGILCMGSRGGKFRDVLAQIGMTFEGSIFWVDPKLQAAAVTARYRQEVLKQDVCILNPFNILPEYLGGIRHALYDPLSKLNPSSPDYGSDADILTEGLMPHGGAEVHWIDSARLLGSGVCMHLRSAFEGANLGTLYKVVSGRDLAGFCDDAVKTSVLDGVAERLDRFGSGAEDNREIRSVISTAITRLGWMGNKRIIDSFSKSTVDFTEMRKRPMTVYVGLPGRRSSSLSPWLRVITNSWADAMLQEGRGDVPNLGVLDEFKTSVGRLGSTETLMGMGAGYGCQLLCVIRDIPELAGAGMYPNGEWESWFANAGWQIFGRNRDWSTCDYVSRITGTTEVHSASKSFGKHPNVSVGSKAMPYLRPEEVRDLPDDECLIFADGIGGVIRAGRRPYYNSPEFFGADAKPKFDPDPYHVKAH
jgi:type IV secretion system protein VirD4